MEKKKSKVLIIGGTGGLGFHLAQLSLQSSHPTFVLNRDSSSVSSSSSSSDPTRQQKIHSLSTAGATLLKGSLEDEKSLIEAVKQVDVVICAIPSKQVLHQKLLIRAIKQVGCIKVHFCIFDFLFYVLCIHTGKIFQRFIPSEFGADPDRTQISDLDHNFYSRRSEIRRLIENEGIPYTYICCNLFMSYFLPSLFQPGLNTPPRDKVMIFGDGNTKGVFVKDSDVAAFTISTLDDPRTLNKVLYLRPPGNVYSMNELVDAWERKIEKKLEKIYVSEEELLKKIKETKYPDNMEMVFIYSIFIKGDHTYFDVESSGGVEGTKLYPHLKYTTISRYLDTLL
ncbi:hypothetical protein EZV62_011553 [Acer yangbiense]|uniref:NmrA-like domain-containing protein n=1 Tax=Acer yangbiense TaxID=1000413 RepID=A0A5C7I715_9ROSI|nr:hypothetical protein EZV62_011553 [Acer yangbiense]